MSNENDIRHGRHCVFMMHVHLVFVTKYRRAVFTKETLDDLRSLFASICADFEAELVEFDGEDDHVHLLVNYPPKVALSALVNSLKGVSSQMIRKRTTQASASSCGVAHCGRRPTSPVAAEARPLRSFANTSNSSRHPSDRQQDGYAGRAILPLPKAEACRAPGQRVTPHPPETGGARWES